MSDPQQPDGADAWRRVIADGDAAYDRTDYPRAEASFRKALSLAWSFGTNHPRIAVSLSRLGRVYIQQRLMDQARDISIQALSTLAAPPCGLDSEEMALTLIALSEASFTIGQVEQAARLVEEAIEHLVRLHGANHEEVGAALARLVMLCDQRGDYEAAVRHLGRLIAICETNFGPIHPRMPEFLEARRDLLRKMGRHVKADELAN